MSDPSPMAPSGSRSPSNMKVSASAAMSSSDRVLPSSSCKEERGSQGAPQGHQSIANPPTGHHHAAMATTLWPTFSMATTISLATTVLL